MEGGRHPPRRIRGGGRMKSRTSTRGRKGATVRIWSVGRRREETALGDVGSEELGPARKSEGRAVEQSAGRRTGGGVLGGPAAAKSASTSATKTASTRRRSRSRWYLTQRSPGEGGHPGVKIAPPGGGGSKERAEVRRRRSCWCRVHQQFVRQQLPEVIHVESGLLTCADSINI